MIIKSSLKDAIRATLTFKYSEVGSRPSPAFPDKETTLVPLVPISFPLADKSSIGYDCIVDSGADCCLFHWEIGEEILGLDVKKGAKLPKIKGLTGDTATVYFHTVRFKIKGWGIDEAYVGFIEKGKLGTKYGILGQEGFFDIFQVIFDKSDDRFQLITKIPFVIGKIEPYSVTKALRESREKRTKTARKQKP